MSDQASTTPVPERLRNDFSSFTLPQYAALGLMVVAVVILGLWFMQWSTTPTWQLVASNLGPGDASTVTDELESAGISSRLVNGGTGIEVPSGDADEALVAIGDSAVGATGAQGYELLDEQGFLASSFKQRVDYQRAIEGELARTIMAMDAVNSAIVHVAIPEDRIFAEEDQLARASVVVDGQLTQGSVASIANVVASAVPGLDPANVTVADTAGRVLNGGGESAMSRDQQLQMEDLYEAQLELAAQTMLATALGPGHSVVRVTADLNFDELEQESVTFDADTQIALREQQIDEAFTGDANVPIGTLGTANDVTDIGDIAGDEGDAYIRTETNAEYGVPSVTTRTRQAPGRVERLSVAVLVDDAVEPSPDPAQLSSLVAAAVGIDETRGDTIVVESLTFDEVAAEELEDAALAAPAAGGGLEPMIAYAKTGVAIVGLLLALLFLRKGLKTLTPVVREPVDIDPAKLAALTAAGDGGQAAEVRAAEAAAKQAQEAAEKQTRELTAAAAADLDVNVAAVETDTTIDMFDLIDAQSDEVAHLLRDLVADSVT